MVLRFFLLPGFCYHSSIVRNIPSVSFQLTSSLLAVPIYQFVGSIFDCFMKGRQYSKCVCTREGITSSVFSEFLQNTPPKLNALLSDVATR